MSTPEQENPMTHGIDADSDEGMLRTARDVLRYGVSSWRTGTFKWLAADLVDRLDARLPGRDEADERAARDAYDEAAALADRDDLQLDVDEPRIDAGIFPEWETE